MMNMKLRRQLTSQEERWNEFLAAFGMLVRTGEGEPVDVREETAEGYINLLVDEVVLLMEPHDLAAAFSGHLYIREELGAVRPLRGDRLMNALAELKQTGKLPLAVDPEMPAESAKRLNGLLNGMLNSEEGCLCYKRIASLLSKALKDGSLRPFLCQKPKAGKRVQKERT